MKVTPVNETVGITIQLSRQEAEDLWYWYSNRALTSDRVDKPDMWRRGINKAGDISADIRALLELK